VSVRGIGWYASAFVALIVSAAFIGIAAASFLASLTPLYVSIVCSVAAVAFGVVAAVRARPAHASRTDEAEPERPMDASVPGDAPEPDASAPDDAPEAADATLPGDTE
jgi:hypothetical protein